MTLIALVLASDVESVNRVTRSGIAPASRTAYLPLVITAILGRQGGFVPSVEVKVPHESSSGL